MNALRSHYLSASAGSGKTVALSVRYCKLVAAGVPPDTICALTFTRAATREIFSAIITRLVKGDVGDLSEAQRLQALERILNALPRLQIATIDAFSAKIARLFAYELELNPDFSLYEEGTGPEAREALHETARRALRVTPKHSANELLQRLDVRYDGSAPTKTLCERLQDFMTTFARLFEAHPDGWGELAALGETLPHTLPRRDEAMEMLRAAAIDHLSAAHQAAFQKLLQEYYPGCSSLRELKARWGGSWKNAEKFRILATEGTHTYRNKVLTLEHAAFLAATRLWEDLIARDLEQAARHTRALRYALEALMQAYADWSSETGRMGFSELTRTLARTLGGQLSMLNEAHVYVAYRLNAAVRHLMIDEFQDTGTDQWAILSGMAEELASAEDSTFFYVGDPKQSIYGWRGGDATLFGDRTRVPDIPEGEALVKSYRSGPDIIALVNRIFNFPHTLFTAAEPWQYQPLIEWRKRWVDHIAYRQSPGYAAAITLAGKTKADWMTALAQAIATRWHELSSRRLSMAVLAPTNNTFQGNGEDEPGLLARLRDLGVTCAIDGRRRVSDTPMGRLVAALLHWMADPRASLWGEIARRLNLAERSDSATLAGWMQIVTDEGFVAWLDALFGPDTPCGKRLTAYDREILATLRLCLESLDARGDSDPAEARRRIADLEVPCSANGNMLSLMTIHHSKGLSFDVVFTLLSGDLINERNAAYEHGRNWVLERPVLKETYATIPALEEARIQRQEHRFRDDLCALYVALTRARHEQLIFAPGKECDKLKRRAGIVFYTLPKTGTPLAATPDARLVFSEGTPTWWQSDTVPLRSTPLPQAHRDPWEKAPSVPVAEVELPSERARATTLANLLAADATTARRFGISEHARLAQIAWLDAEDARNEWLPEALRPFFQKPPKPCELWRERAFSVRISEGETLRYIAGQFDRVHLFPEAQCAIIYDFKTAHQAECAPAYVRQLSDYRTALSILTGWPKKRIRTFLLFTRSGISIEVPNA